MPDHYEQQETLETAESFTLNAPELGLFHVELGQKQWLLECYLLTDDVPFENLDTYCTQVEQAGSRPGAVLKNAVGEHAVVLKEGVDDELYVQGQQTHCVEQEWRQCALVLRHLVVIVNAHEVEYVEDSQVSGQTDEQTFRPDVLRLK